MAEGVLPLGAMDKNSVLNQPNFVTLAVAAEEDPQYWSTILRPRNPWFCLDLREVWRYRDLIYLFVRRDLVAQYKQTVLGPLWFLLQPLFTTLVFTLVFGRIAQIPTDGVPDFLFYLAGTVCWSYFASCFSHCSEMFIANAAIFAKVYFPRLVIPVYSAISDFFKFLIQFALFCAFLWYFFPSGQPFLSWRLVWFPLILLETAILAIGCGMLVSSLTTRYRDLKLVVSFGLQLLMFASPVIYPLSRAPERFRHYLALNPMAAILETFRSIFFDTPFPAAFYIFWSWVATLGLLLVGLVLFSKVEKNFIDTI